MPTKRSIADILTDDGSWVGPTVAPTWTDTLASTAVEPGSYGATALVQTLYLKEAGDTATISVNDLHQGQIGDCFLISSIGELALFHPTSLSNMVKLNANGTETVTLYTGVNGRVPGYGATAFKAVSVSVTNLFPNYSVNSLATQDVVGNQKEIWAQVLEKAYATLYGGYDPISSGGNPTIAMGILTGKSARAVAPGSLTADFLTKNADAGNLIVFDTANSRTLPYNLVGNHAYMFEKLTMVNGAAMVQLGNPWGYNQPSLIPLSQVTKAFVEIDVGQV